MYLVDDSGKPYVALFSVQYAPTFSDRPSRPHDVCFKLTRDPKDREGVFVQPFSYGGISPVAMSRIKWRPFLNSDGRSFRPTDIPSNSPVITMMPRESGVTVPGMKG